MKNTAELLLRRAGRGLLSAVSLHTFPGTLSNFILSNWTMKDLPICSEEEEELIFCQWYTWCCAMILLQVRL